MCGFVGFVEFEKSSLRREDLLRMRDTLSHRGPDDKGDFFEPGIGLGHTRLSILDLSEKAHQPFLRGHFVMVYNGEVYNFRELRKELEAIGYTFSSESDTEVILAAYQQWGKEALMKFNGMFAFAVFDRRKRTLFLARDRMGIKPLFYYARPGFFIFGSEIKAMRACSYFNRCLSQDGLETYLRLGYTTGRQTIWDNCLRVFPGESLEIDIPKKSIFRQSYWQPQMTSQKMNFLEAKERIKNVLAEEVKKSLVSDVPIGACISGGVDSNVLIAILRKELNIPLRTYSLGSSRHKFDENQAAQAVAHYLGTQHTSILFDLKECGAFLLETARHFDEPLADQNILSFRSIARRARKDGVPVLLCGMGGDELFYGYPTVNLMADVYKIFKWPYSLRRLLPKTLFKFSNPCFKAAHVIQQYDYASALVAITGKSFFGDEIERLLVHKSSSQNHPQAFFPIKNSTRDQRVQHILTFDLKNYLPNNSLHLVDMSTMSEGVEMRVPYLNYPVVDLALQIPVPIQYYQGRYKALLRAIEADYLPPSLRLPGKRGFHPFIKDAWLDHELKDYVGEYLSPTRLNAQGLFNYQLIDSLFRLKKHSRVNVSHKIWTMLVFQIWAENNLS